MRAVCNNISESEYKSLVKLLQMDCTFYFAGEGRSGLIARIIAMRLMHAGKNVYVVGETITPAIEPKDIVILLSGSGKTNQTLHVGKSASKCGAIVFLVTTNREMINSTWCSGGLCIPAATKLKFPGEPVTIQPLGNQFDQSAHIILDAAIVSGLKSPNLQQEMKRKHSNLE